MGCFHGANAAHQRTGAPRSGTVHQCVHTRLPPCSTHAASFSAASCRREETERAADAAMLLATRPKPGPHCSTAQKGALETRINSYPLTHLITGQSSVNFWQREGLASQPADELLDRVIAGLVHLEELPVWGRWVPPGPAGCADDCRASGCHTVSSGPANPCGRSGDEHHLATQVLHRNRATMVFLKLANALHRITVLLRLTCQCQVL